VHRIDGPGYAPGNRFTEGDPVGGVPATVVTDDWLNAVQEEVCGVIEAGGEALDKLDSTQLLEALRRLYGGHVTSVAATATLTLADAGLVVVDATGGDITITLPAASDLSAARFTFVRMDGTANTVTIDPAGADTIEGAASATLVGRLALIGNGVDTWWMDDATVSQATDAAPGVVELATAAEVQAGTDTSRAVTPATLGEHDGCAKAWVSFNGTGTVAIRGGFNVASITDNGTGDYTVNFATPFSDANYAAAGMAGANDSPTEYTIVTTKEAVPQTPSAYRVVTYDDGLNVHDSAYVQLVFFGRQ